MLTTMNRFFLMHHFVLLAVSTALTFTFTAAADALPLGAECTATPDKCQSGLFCLGDHALKKCVPGKTQDMKCQPDPYWNCQPHLHCFNAVCKPKLSHGEECHQDGIPCQSGLYCLGTAPIKKCVQGKEEGMKCQPDPYWSCQPHLHCVHSVCKPKPLPLGEHCDPDGPPCESGLHCLGGADVKKCVEGKKDGMQCQTDPFWSCQPHLHCVDSVCKPKPLPLGEVCQPDGAPCQSGLYCLGGGTVKKCVHGKPKGMECQLDPFWSCQPHLTCVNGLCEPKPLPVGDVCDPYGVPCDEGLFCLGHSVKKCVEGKPMGMPCALDPFWSCKPGLQCVANKCEPKPLPEGEVCKTDGAPCETGLFCLGDTVKKCVRGRHQGEQCKSDPFWFCKPHLQCVNEKCEPKPIAPGNVCEPHGTPCQHGLYCLGEKVKKCVEGKPDGTNCDLHSEPSDFCTPPLQCIENICKPKPLTAGQVCKTDGTPCEKGLFCLGKGVKKCFYGRGPGYYCGYKARNSCKPGLTCARFRRKRICIKIGGLGDKCGYRIHTICKSGLRCGGRWLGRCYQRVGKGAACDSKKYKLCKPWLVCRRGYCERRV